MESPLDVLSRAATMIQNNNMETKQLPTTKWKRERRARLSSNPGVIPNFHNANNISERSTNTESTQNGVKPRIHTIDSHSDTSDVCTNSEPSEVSMTMMDCDNAHSPSESPTRSNSPIITSHTNSITYFPTIQAHSAEETPLDMTVASLRRKSPPPYPQPAEFRPSVITQTPSKPAQVQFSPPNKDAIPNSMSMCDPVIEEHFRRSLGNDYQQYIQNTKVQPVKATPSTPTTVKQLAVTPVPVVSSPISSSTTPIYKPCTTELNLKTKKTESSPLPPTDTDTVQSDFVKDFTKSFDTGLSVDDHFAKALGDTWKKLQANPNSIEKPTTNLGKKTSDLSLLKIK